MNPAHWLNNPMFGVGGTLLVYLAALACRRRWRWMHPLVSASAVLIVLLTTGHIPLAFYQSGGDWLSLCLGPVTVALAVPLYKNARRIKEALLPVLAGITAGSLISVAFTALLLSLTGSPEELIRSMLSKSVSAPIAMEIARRAGGIPELSASFSVLTGLVGSVTGPAVLRLCGIRGDIPLGTAMGTSAHGIGTARMIAESQSLGGISGFSMAAAGIITSVLMIPLYWII
ncbi:LrgB family protein [Paenibacillus sp. YIM B09110]|uniref:LrgB family protein n=1 Tax=Paenibacillus sp. YIM B09110 TaxID=3126102 RepID=UPI00301BFA35